MRLKKLNRKGAAVPPIGIAGVVIFLLLLFFSQRQPTEAPGATTTTTLVTTTTLGDIQCEDSWPLCNGYCTTSWYSCQPIGSTCQCLPSTTTTTLPTTTTITVTTTTLAVTTTTLGIRVSCAFINNQLFCSTGECDPGYACIVDRSYPFFGRTPCMCVSTATTTTTSTTTTTIDACHDSDGLDYYNKGYRETPRGSNRVWDHCNNVYPSYLYEMKCVGDVGGYDYHYCTYGCYDGACRTSATTTTTVPMNPVCGHSSGQYCYGYDVAYHVSTYDPYRCNTFPKQIGSTCLYDCAYKGVDNYDLYCWCWDTDTCADYESCGSSGCYGVTTTLPPTTTTTISPFSCSYTCDIHGWDYVGCTYTINNHCWESLTPGLEYQRLDVTQTVLPGQVHTCQGVNCCCDIGPPPEVDCPTVCQEGGYNYIGCATSGNQCYTGFTSNLPFAIPAGNWWCINAMSDSGSQCCCRR